MADRETVITHLQIIHTWAEFARERDLQFFTAKHLESIAEWTDDAISLLKEQETELCDRCGRRRAKSNRVDGEARASCNDDYCELNL
jgi:hypothetical protein